MGTKAAQGTAVNKFQSKELAHSATSRTNVNKQYVIELAKNIQEKFVKFNELLLNVQKSFNKDVEQYTCLLTELHDINKGQGVNNKPNIANRKRKERKNLKRIERINETLEANKKHIKNLSNKELTNGQISLVSKGLKFIPTPVTNDNLIRRQLLQDFNQFARRMRLQYIFHRQHKEPHPFHVKSNSEPPVQQSVALESFLERVKYQLAEIHITKPRNNLLPAEQQAVRDLKTNTEINIRKADKGTTSVFMSLADKKNEGQTQLDNMENYLLPLASC